MSLPSAPPPALCVNTILTGGLYFCSGNTILNCLQGQSHGWSRACWLRWFFFSRYFVTLEFQPTPMTVPLSFSNKPQFQSVSLERDELVWWPIDFQHALEENEKEAIFCGTFASQCIHFPQSATNTNYVYWMTDTLKNRDNEGWFFRIVQLRPASRF